MKQFQSTFINGGHKNDQTFKTNQVLPGMRKAS
jgi:hypothetical protein